MQKKPISRVGVTTPSTDSLSWTIARLSFNLLLWVNDNGKADARLIYEELAKEALLRLHTRTTDWRNDSAMLQQEVKQKALKTCPRRSLDKIEAFVREKMLKISLEALPTVIWLKAFVLCT